MWILEKTPQKTSKDHQEVSVRTITTHTKPSRAPWAKAKEENTTEGEAQKGRTNVGKTPIDETMFYGQMKPK